MPPRFLTPEEFFNRVISRIRFTESCWEWIGAKHPSGYGSLGERGDAHRWMYEQLVGPIKSGLTLDHLCRNRGCVNPDHLEVTTHRINILRGVSPTARQARQTHCKNGHVLPPPNKKGHRQCYSCWKAWQDAHRKLA